MYSENLNDFVELLARDPALSLKIGLDEAVSNPNFDNAMAFAAAAVKAGSELGLALTQEECRDWLDEQAGHLASPELSDMQMDVVTGGAASATSRRRMSAVALRPGAPPLGAPPLGVPSAGGANSRRRSAQGPNWARSQVIQIL